MPFLQGNWFQPAEPTYSLDATVFTALAETLDDDCRPVRLAAVGTLSFLLHHCRIDVVVRAGIMAALLGRWKDDCQAVRIAALRMLAAEEIPEVPASGDDAWFLEQTSMGKDLKTQHKARREMAYRETTGCFARLLHDPSPRLREQTTELVALFEMGEGVRDLSQRDALALIQTVKEAEPVAGRDLVARQELVWALQWLSEQWRFREAYDYGDDELERRLEEPTASLSILRTRDAMGQLARAPVEKVVAALHDRDIAVRLAALDALLKIGSAGAGVNDHVAAMLRDSCQQVRWRAEETLADMVFHKVSQGVQEEGDCGDVPF